MTAPFRMHAVGDLRLEQKQEATVHVEGLCQRNKGRNLHEVFLQVASQSDKTSHIPPTVINRVTLKESVENSKAIRSLLFPLPLPIESGLYLEVVGNTQNVCVCVRCVCIQYMHDLTKRVVNDSNTNNM